MTYTLYGIKACDTMKKARTWLEDKAIAYEFHDYKTQGIDRDSAGVTNTAGKSSSTVPAPPSASSTTPARPTSTRPRPLN